MRQATEKLAIITKLTVEAIKRRRLLQGILLAIVALGIIAGGYYLYTKKFKTKVIYESKPTQAQLNPTSLYKGPIVKSKLCDDITADTLGRGTKLPVNKATSLQFKATVNGIIIDGCNYTLASGNSQPVKQITILARHYTANNLAKAYLETLSKNSGQAETIKGLGDQAVYLKSANQLMVRRGSVLYIVTAAVTKPSSSTKSALLSVGKVLVSK